ncbi:UDP-glycosyltransferase 73C5 [Triticum urartu]|uniref:Glycosyltransferase n=2 Tax=Triticum TaxID=4564 RepID=A0A9R0VGM5_TRITD|nr:UDP-glycosyltransferase 73C5 [Triticum urartu]VAH58343.1 unnamed protein product [Triticum turgidum subsp. durum]
MAASELHFLLVPLVAQGHIIPMVDLARLLAARGPRVTVVTTPVNAARNRATVDSARRAGLAIELAELPFPGPQLGLPEGLENLDQLLDDVSSTTYLAFFQAIWKMAEPLQGLVLHCPSAYFLLAVHNLSTHGVYDRVGDDELEPFEVPDFPDRGLVVRGWAPQVTILSHRAVGGFLTHCGWNATLEAISHGVPTLTWPCFADQFCSERLLVDVLRVGVRSGVKVPAKNVPEEAEGVQVPSGDMEKAIAELMDGGSEGMVRRSRAKEVAAEMRVAMEEGGSSYSDLTDMIHYVSELSRKSSHERDGSSMTLPFAVAELRSNDSDKIEAGAALSLQS